MSNLGSWSFAGPRPQNDGRLGCFTVRNNAPHLVLATPAEADEFGAVVHFTLVARAHPHGQSGIGLVCSDAEDRQHSTFELLSGSIWQGIGLKADSLGSHSLPELSGQAPRR